MSSPPKTQILDPLIGQTVKQYRVETLLGEGGMGQVYRAHDNKLLRPVALKVISSQWVTDPDRRRRILTEARAAARVIHPAIAQIYDVEDENDLAFIAMELVEGRTVRQLIHDQDLDLIGAIDVAIQVGEGLAKAHDLGIVHRDIKPANVIVNPDGHAKILDFGIAKILAPSGAAAPGDPQSDLTTFTETQPGAIKGTFAYMSPEQVKGQKIDPRSDVFSLGVLLFEMTTGDLPFRRPSPVETIQAVAFEPHPTVQSIRPHLPTQLQRILDRCLSKSPDDRYESARSLVADLRALKKETESGAAPSLSFKQRATDLFREIRQWRTTDYRRLASLAAIAALAIFLLARNFSIGSLIALGLLGTFIYRHFRNQPQRALSTFVRKVSRIPEVRVIAHTEEHITVVVDRMAGPLYGRINDQLRRCNEGILYGKPFRVSIQHDLPPDQLTRTLASPGVQYVRDEPERAA